MVLQTKGENALSRPRIESGIAGNEARQGAKPETYAEAVSDFFADEFDNRPDKAGTTTLKAIAQGKLGLESASAQPQEKTTPIPESQPETIEETKNKISPSEAQQTSIDVLTNMSKDPNQKDATGIGTLAEHVQKGNLDPELAADVSHYLREHAQKLVSEKTPRELDISFRQRAISDRLHAVMETPLDRGQEGYQAQQNEKAALVQESKQLSAESQTLTAQKQAEADRIMEISQNADLLSQAAELKPEEVASEIEQDEQAQMEKRTEKTENLPQQNEKDKPAPEVTTATESEKTVEQKEIDTDLGLRTELELVEANLEKMSLEQLHGELIKTERFTLQVTREQELLSLEEETTMVQMESYQQIQLEYDRLIDEIQSQRRDVPPSITEGRDRMIALREQANNRLGEIHEDQQLMDELREQTDAYKITIEKRIKDVEDANKNAGYELPVDIFNLTAGNTLLRERMQNELANRKERGDDGPTSLMDWFFMLMTLRRSAKG